MCYNLNCCLNGPAFFNLFWTACFSSVDSMKTFLLKAFLVFRKILNFWPIFRYMLTWHLVNDVYYLLFSDWSDILEVSKEDRCCGCHWSSATVFAHHVHILERSDILLHGFVDCVTALQGWNDCDGSNPENWNWESIQVSSARRAPLIPGYMAVVFNPFTNLFLVQKSPWTADI